jgi:O-6-methylguanine DNA methyltransferase
MPCWSFKNNNKSHTLTGTAFQIQDWRELLKIPKGKTISYAELAKRIGRPNAYRAVANACGKNPLPPIIPCHRVIASDGSLGGYSAGPVSRKAALLRQENTMQVFLKFHRY